MKTLILLLAVSLSILSCSKNAERDLAIPPKPLPFVKMGYVFNEVGVLGVFYTSDPVTTTGKVSFSYDLYAAKLYLGHMDTVVNLSYNHNQDCRRYILVGDNITSSMQLTLKNVTVGTLDSVTFQIPSEIKLY